ncbi:hypothetical protein [Burkholderia lata]|uniref:hypothetical protein n=1 Tax=Burkholderia lata (strain ATCC 17760 / DSM 23089 / LMG 22485 / NCIMB 9086 / R18194 / 383) TaxID=482957 RepID=UPI00399B2BFC
MRATIDAVWRRSAAGSVNDFILDGGRAADFASLAIPYAVYFESGRIISRIPDIRPRMQNMHADTAIPNRYASLPVYLI